MSSFVRVFILLLTGLGLMTQAYSIPMINQLGGIQAAPEYLTITTEGRPEGERFSNLNALIASGDSLDLIRQAQNVLATNPDSSLALEVLGVGYLMRMDIGQAISAFGNAARLDSNESGPLGKLGLMLMETDRLSEAEEALRAALQANPNDQFVHRNLGLLYDFQENPNQAILHLQAGLSGQPSGFILEAVTLARLYGERGQYQQAVAVLQDRIPVSSDIEAAQYTLASSFVGAKQWQDAVVRFDRVMALNPDNTIASFGRAVALRGAGQVDESIEILQDLSGRYDIGLQATVELGLSLLSAGRNQEASETLRSALLQGATQDGLDETVAAHHLQEDRFDEARSAYQALLDRDAGSAQAYVNHSELLFANDQVQDAVDIMQTGRQRYPDNAYLAFRLGNTYASVGSYESAVAELQQAVEMAPRDIGILRSLSLAQSRLNRNNDALESALVMVELAPERPDVLLFTALAYERAGEIQNAISTYDSVLEVQPQNIGVINNLSYLLATTGDLERASQLIEQVAPDIGDSPPILDTLGFVRLQRGEHQAAREPLQKAVELAPEFATAHYHLALVLIELDQANDARQALEQALALEPEADWAGDATEQLAKLSN